MTVAPDASVSYAFTDIDSSLDASHNARQHSDQSYSMHEFDGAASPPPVAAVGANHRQRQRNDQSYSMHDFDRSDVPQKSHGAARATSPSLVGTVGAKTTTVNKPRSPLAVVTSTATRVAMAHEISAAVPAVVAPTADLAGPDAADAELLQSFQRQITVVDARAQAARAKYLLPHATATHFPFSDLCPDDAVFSTQFFLFVCPSSPPSSPPLLFWRAGTMPKRPIWPRSRRPTTAHEWPWLRPKRNCT